MKILYICFYVCSGSEIKQDSRNQTLSQFWMDKELPPFQEVLAFVLKLHLIICSHFRPQQFCHLWMCFHLLVNTTSEEYVIPERQRFLFDSTDGGGYCSMIRAMGTAPQKHPLTHCHQAQVLMRSEESPHITS